MQIIENAILRLTVEEKNARPVELINKQNNLSIILESQDLNIFFPSEDNPLSDTEWTVVDKGDTEVSLSLVENKESIKIFPYHYNLMVTYQLNGNQMKMIFTLRNDSRKEMSSELSVDFDLALSRYEIEENLSEYKILNDEQNIDFSFDIKPQINIEKIDNGLKVKMMNDLVVNPQNRIQRQIILTVQ